MGLLVIGEWKDRWDDTDSTGGRSVRQDSAFRDRVTADASSGFAAESGRHLPYLSYGSHRNLNPTGIVPVGPAVDWNEPHRRG